ncbi:hypothetical protein [Fibrobacter sp. UBA4309]|jgi:hypothetical protein|uniref:hypothetical protein n=1 Tax=Fibrobacter sp. UBA4309 TaxID=1946537 RepID=UPI0015650FC5|nr:hypothetical protein [Fibrobacter sp. UBA4309]
MDNKDLYVWMNIRGFNMKNVNEPEVLDIPKENLDKSANAQWKKTLAIVFTIATALYDFLPIDLMPMLPFDNLGLTSAALLNLVQQFTANQDSKLVQVLKFAKWTFVVLVIIAVLLFGGLVALLMNLLAK